MQLRRLHKIFASFITCSLTLSQLVQLKYLRQLSRNTYDQLCETKGDRSNALLISTKR